MLQTGNGGRGNNVLFGLSVNISVILFETAVSPAVR